MTRRPDDPSREPDSPEPDPRGSDPREPDPREPDDSPTGNGAPGSLSEGSTEALGRERRTSGSSEQQQPPEGTVTAREPTPMTQQIGRVVIVLLAVLFGVFAVDNSQPVDFAWVFGESQVAPDGTGGVPLIVLLVGAAAIGAALGALIEWQFLRARRARRADRERD